MKKILLILALVGSIFANDVFDEELRKSFKTINDAMPLQLAPNVKWVSVDVKENKNIVYKFIFEDKDLIESHVKTKNKTLFNMCTEQTNKVILAYGYTITAEYFFKDVKIDEIKLTKGSCKYE